MIYQLKGDEKHKKQTWTLEPCQAVSRFIDQLSANLQRMRINNYNFKQLNFSVIYYPKFLWQQLADTVTSLRFHYRIATLIFAYITIPKQCLKIGQYSLRKYKPLPYIIPSLNSLIHHENLIVLHFCIFYFYLYSSKCCRSYI